MLYEEEIMKGEKYRPKESNNLENSYCGFCNVTNVIWYCYCEQKDGWNSIAGK
jgi:hypothetical protein